MFKCFRSFPQGRARRTRTGMACWSLCFHFVHGIQIARVLGVMVSPGRVPAGRLGQSWVPFLGFFIKASQVGNRKVWPRVSLSVHQSLSLEMRRECRFLLDGVPASAPLSGCLMSKMPCPGTIQLPGPVCSSDARFCVVSLLAL